MMIKNVFHSPPLSLTSVSYAGSVIYFERGSPELLAAARVAVKGVMQMKKRPASPSRLISVIPLYLFLECKTMNNSNVF